MKGGLDLLVRTYFLQLMCATRFPPETLQWRRLATLRTSPSHLAVEVFLPFLPLLRLLFLLPMVSAPSDIFSVIQERQGAR